MREHDETYLSTFGHAPQAHSWLSRADEDARRPQGHQRPSREGPQAPRGLTAAEGSGSAAQADASLLSARPCGAVVTDAGFPKSARLLKTDEFSSVFRLRPWGRSAHFVLYLRETDTGGGGGKPARLGLVIGRKFAPRAATRNALRRLARDAFRIRRGRFGGCDVLLRLHSRFDRSAFPSAASAPLKRLCRAEFEMLLDGALARLAKQAAAREARSVPPPVASPPSPSSSCESS